MTNEMKLLRAFIEASGFDVEDVVTVTKPKFNAMKALYTDRYNQQGPITTIDYKVTKKNTVPHCDKCGRDINPMSNQ